MPKLSLQAIASAYDCGDIQKFLAACVDLLESDAPLSDAQLNGLGRLIGLVIMTRPPSVINSNMDSQPACPAQVVDASELPTPLVSVLIPSYNHAAYVGAALASVAAQTYRNIELIVIDDGSQDDSKSVICHSIRDMGFPVRTLFRGNCGADVTINELLGLARGEFFNILNSDDTFSPDRLHRFVTHCTSYGVAWAFGEVSFIHDSSMASLARANELHAINSQLADSNSLSENFLFKNPAISTGNIFMRTDLARAIGAFRSYRYVHDWDFCLRALWHHEPAYLAGSTYGYRIHASNTINESHAAAYRESAVALADYLRAADVGAAPNPLAPCRTTGGECYFVSMLRSNYGFAAGRQRVAASARDCLLRLPELTTSQALP